MWGRADSVECVVQDGIAGGCRGRAETAHMCGMVSGGGKGKGWPLEGLEMGGECEIFTVVLTYKRLRLAQSAIKLRNDVLRSKHPAGCKGWATWRRRHEHNVPRV